MGTPYVIREGDTLSSIAETHGLPDWKKLYFADENKEFRARRPDPDRIMPGDVIVIPGEPADADLADFYGSDSAGMDGSEVDWRDQSNDEPEPDEPQPPFIPFADEDDTQGAYQVCRRNLNTINTRPAGFPWFSA